MVVVDCLKKMSWKLMARNCFMRFCDNIQYICDWLPIAWETSTAVEQHTVERYPLRMPEGSDK